MRNTTNTRLQEENESPSSPPQQEHCFSIPMANNHNFGSKRINPFEVQYDDDRGGDNQDHHDVENAGIKRNDDQEEQGNNNIEAWLPITESRKGNLYYCIFHLLSSGIGLQSLALPFAFATLGWVWGTTWLSIAFMWQLYTIWLLVHLHESPSGQRCSRYLQLAIAAFGPKLGKLLAIFPVMFLSGGTCVMLLIIGGGTMQHLHQILCGDALSCATKSLTTVEWFLVFICLAIAIAQLPNLNSIAWISLVSAITAVVYTSLIWILSISEGRPSDTRHSILFLGSEDRVSGIMRALSAVGIVCFSFRGHNLVVEIQGTLPASKNDPTHKRMWRGVIISYALIALCMFPLAIAAYWAYGHLVPKAGMLSGIAQLHGHHGSKLPQVIIYFLLLINCLCSFQIYAMLVFDNLELRYVSIRKKPCTWWSRAGLRLFFGGLAFFMSVAIPFLPLLAPLTGAITLPVTFAYPCFMWLSIKKPKQFGSMWWLNIVLGCLGVLLSVLLVVAAIWTFATQGIDANFFHPRPY